jgi:hypothetical protein
VVRTQTLKPDDDFAALPARVKSRPDKSRVAHGIFPKVLQSELFLLSASPLTIVTVDGGDRKAAGASFQLLQCGFAL